MGRELALPAEQREQIAFRDERHRAMAHQRDGMFRVARGDRMPDGVRPLLLFRIPPACAPVQAGDFVGMLDFESSPQIFAHQMVIAKPVSFDVERFEQ
ncbi:hypothetical protein [Paraburkholderia terrae]